MRASGPAPAAPRLRAAKREVKKNFLKCVLQAESRVDYDILPRPAAAPQRPLPALPAPHLFFSVASVWADLQPAASRSAVRGRRCVRLAARLS